MGVREGQGMALNSLPLAQFLCKAFSPQCRISHGLPDGSVAKTVVILSPLPTRLQKSLSGPRLFLFRSQRPGLLFLFRSQRPGLLLNERRRNSHACCG